MKVFKGLILFSSFRPNKSKCEVSGVENEWKWLLYSLAQQKVKEFIFVVLNKLKTENFIKSVFKTEKRLKYWKIVNIAIEGKFFFLKALAVSKIYIFRY